MKTHEQKKLFEAVFKIEGNKVEVQQMELIHLLEGLGFGICRDAQSAYNNQLVYKRSNLIHLFNKDNLGNHLITLMKAHSINELFIEKFIRGISNYLSTPKLNLLKKIDLNIVKNTRETTYFPFNNKIVEVSSDEIKIKKYDELQGSVMSESRIDKKISLPTTSGTSSFKQFCKMITGNNEERFNSLRSILGYLLHPNKEARENKIIILYDAIMGSKTTANGGTGKTLLINGAINELRNVVLIDGKRYDDRTNRFLYQNVNPTTNIVLFDDVNDKFKLEDIFSASTGDFEVEKKGKQSFVLKYNDAPKFVVSSNSRVKMVEGASSNRRKLELVLDNVFNDKFKPADYFEEIFFSSDWDEEKFNKFFFFMFECVQFYHRNGLIVYEDQNLIDSRTRSEIGSDLYDFLDKQIVPNHNGSWVVKKETVEFWKKEYDDEITSHTFTKSMRKYCESKRLVYEELNSGSVLYFKISDTKTEGGSNE